MQSLDTKTFLRFRERYQPIKDSLRKVRQTLPAEVKEPSERLYAFTNIIYYLIKVSSSTKSNKFPSVWQLATK